MNVVGKFTLFQSSHMLNKLIYIRLEALLLCGDIGGIKSRSKFEKCNKNNNRSLPAVKCDNKNQANTCFLCGFNDGTVELKSFLVAVMHVVKLTDRCNSSTKHFVECVGAILKL